MAYIKTFQNQTWLLPPSLKDMIHENHVCFLVEDFVNTLDFARFDQDYEGPGHPAYPPRILMKILLQGMIDKTRSSRDLAKACRENLVFIYLSEKVQPQYRTIARFRQYNASLIKEAFKQTVRFASSHNLIDLNLISIDGTFIKANAGQKSRISKDALELLDKAIDKMIQEDIEIDNLDEEMYGDSEANLTGRDRKNIRKLLQEFQEKEGKVVVDKVDKLKKEFEKDPNQKRLSLSDPESRVLRNKHNYLQPTYNAQFSVDSKNQIIIANDVCQDHNDYDQLAPQIANIEENVGPLTEENKLDLDAGYSSAKNCAFLEEKKLDGYIPTKAQAQVFKGNYSTWKNQKYEYDLETDEVIEDGLRFQYLSTRLDKGKKVMRYRNKATKRIKRLPVGFQAALRMRDKMETEDAKEIYSKRKHIVEPAIGNIKHNLDFREFLTRGINSAKIELNLVSIAHNLKKVWKYGRTGVEAVSKGTAMQNLFLRFRLFTC
jgi:transposase